jgi:peptidoglycan hydrolase-like protein with peptidoglycan-binding domain
LGAPLARCGGVRSWCTPSAEQRGLAREAAIKGEQIMSAGEILKRGSKGSSVTALQGQLNTLGYDLATDGDFGHGTEDAVKHLQKSFGYTVDGIVGDGTRFLINQQIGLGWKSNPTNK